MTNGGMRNSSHKTLGTEHLHSRECPTQHPHRPSSPRLSQLRNDVTSASLIRFPNPQNAPPNIKIPTHGPPTTDKQYAQTPRGIFVTQETRKRPSDEREPFLIPNAPSLTDPSPENVCPHSSFQTLSALFLLQVLSSSGLSLSENPFR
ncbi:hypothetical protein M0R45_014584 [Rubus argutus]|uniref:Uncharacterized protein n=1 Tax=Rubus argutus TaxID=59490 RepID=A0AAW1XLQ7_RUBAR